MIRILDKLFLNIFQTSINASIVIIIFILMAKFFENKINIKIKYILWILVIIRFLVPVMPEVSTKTINIAEKLYTLNTQSQNQQAVENIESNDTESINEKADNNNFNSKTVENYTNINVQNINSYNKVGKSSNKKINILPIIRNVAAFIWSVGFFASITIFILGFMHFNKRSVILDKNKYKHIICLTKELSKRLNIDRDIKVYISNQIKSPCISGIIKPKIFIPKYILEIDDDKLTHIFLHELMHYKRKDIYLNFLSIIAISLHWFNPLAWFAINNVKNYREYVCDASVLEVLGEEKNIEYGTTLIDCSRKIIERKTIDTNAFNVVVCFEDKNQIKERIKMIKGFKNGSIKITKKSALCCLVAIGVIFSGGIVLFNNNQSNAAVSANSESIEEEKAEEINFIVDTNQKGYHDINKAKRTIGYDFKLPNYFMEGNSYWGTCIRDTNCSILEVKYDVAQCLTDNRFILYIFKGEPVDSLRTLETYYGNLDARSEEKELSIGSITGKEISVIDEAENIDFKYFAFQDNDVWYAIQYKGWAIDVSQEEMKKVIDSLVDFSELDMEKYPTNINVMNDGIISSNIYTKDDFDEAIDTIGFNAKVPVNVTEDIKVGLINYVRFKTNGEDVYTMDITYTGGIHLWETKKTESSLKESMDSLKENSKSVGDEVEISKLNDIDIEVYKIIRTYENSLETSYVWEEDGVRYQLMFHSSERDDDLARKFIKAEKIEK